MNQQKNLIMDIIQSRRSIRRFSDKKISKDVIKQILNAGRWAPSGLNNQPWRFLVVMEGDEKKPKLAECTKYSYIIEGAKALIVVFLDKESVYHTVKDCQAIGACIQNMLLVTHSMGLGGVWLGEILNQSEKVCHILHVDSERYDLMAVVALGYPAEKGASSRKELKDLMLKSFD